MTKTLKTFVLALLALPLTTACTIPADRDDARAKKSEADEASSVPALGGAPAGQRSKRADGTKAQSNGDEGAAAPAAPSGSVSPASFELIEMKIAIDEATGDAKEDTWRYFRLWAEVKNGSPHVVRDIVGDIRYFDAAGKELGVDSISTAVKQDLGDDSPGERVSAEVSFVQPGARVPISHIRSLDKIGGKVASYKITFRPAEAVSTYPRGAFEIGGDQVGELPDESLPGSSPLERRVIKGTIRNDGKVGCAKPGLVVGLYDSSGKLAEIRESDAPVDVVAPGASAPVTLSTLVGFDDAWKAKADFKAWVRCSEP